MVKALKDAGAQVDYREIEDGGHEAWLPAYLPEAAIAFMFRHVRDATPLGSGTDGGATQRNDR
jgi:acetyl esterase/lipase